MTKAQRSGAFLAIASFLVSASVMFGWSVGCRGLVSWNIGSVTSKPITSLMMMLVALGLLALSRKSLRMEVAGSAFTVGALAIAFLMALDSLSGWASGLRTLLVDERASWAVHSERPGEPSFGTLLSVGVLACGAMAIALELPFAARACARAAMAIALVAIVGHALGAPALYWLQIGTSSAMAIPTCVSAVLAGAACERISLR